MAPQAPLPRSPRSKGLHGLLPWLVDAAQCVPVMLERKTRPHPYPGGTGPSDLVFGLGWCWKQFFEISDAQGASKILYLDLVVFSG
jgi:hypothetical protein